jgi:hypothetical protein
MASTNRRRVKGRSGDTFTMLPHHVFRANGNKPPPTAVLSKISLLLLIEITLQFNGANNGNLSAAPKILEPYGWSSRGTIDKAIVENIAKGFLMQTRQGGKNRCSLYAVTWRGVDAGPHDAQQDPVPSKLWLPENAHLRDANFVARWQKRQRCAGENASRIEDKRSRVADKSAPRKAA